MSFDLISFNTQVHMVATDQVKSQVKLFNDASAGAITLASPHDENKGDFAMRASFQAISGLVRRRDVYNGDAEVDPVRLTQLQSNSVKIAAGTPPVEFEQAQYNWIRQNPQTAAVVIAEQLAEAMLLDMLNTAVSGACAAITNTPALSRNAAGTLTFGDLIQGAGAFGDRQARLAAWVLHSKSMTDLYANAIANNERLFHFGTVNVMRDPFGRLLIMTDADPLVIPANGDQPARYQALGLVPGAVMVEQNDDFDANLVRANGAENIQSSYQAEWTYNLGILGYSWKETGGKAPGNAAIANPGNWVRTAASHKDTAGVLVIAQ